MRSVGSFVPGDSALHRLDPRVKLFLLLLWSACLFAVQSPWAIVALCALSVALFWTTGSRVADVLRGLSPMAVVFLVMIASNSLRFDGTAAVGLVGSFGFEPSGLVRSLVAVTRISCLVVLALSVTATTSVTRLTDALDWALAPLRRFGFPADDVSTMLSIAIRFIPVCSEQMDRIVLAQRARGAKFGEGSLWQRVRVWVPVMIPLFVGLFRQSEHLSDAMAARQYGVAPRTKLTVLRANAFDVAVLAAGTLLAVAAALLL